MIVAVLTIVSVLLFTSKTYLEIPVLLVTFGVAALLNVGTNFLLGEISFISDSIAIILQLALAIDYAIILCHRYTEERVFQEPREAVIAALSKAIPEISSSSLTTISGLMALMFMQFKIGFDMGLVLIKAIVLSMASVFILMPGLLLVFSKGIDKTAHKNFVPNIKPLGKLVVKTRYILPPLFILEITDSVVGLSNVEAGEEYIITDPLTPRQFSEMADLDIEMVNLLYTAYAISDESYGQVINGLDTYTVPLIDMFFFMNQEKVSGFVTLDDEMQKDLDDLYAQLRDAKLQLKGENYTRILLNTHLPEEGEKTFEWLDKLHQIAGQYYPKDVYLVGESTNDFDLYNFFIRDNKVIGITSAIFVMIVLLFTFQSAGLPVLLMMVIQGSIWINFAIPKLMGVNVFFISYLIVTSIQMGANIDYAIIITGRFQDLKQTMPPKDAIVEALNQAFPTVITSGTILASAGLLIGFLSSEPSISSIGLFLGRGTIISMVLVMTILPQILLLGNKIIDRTGFKIKGLPQTKAHKGYMKVNGHVRGHVYGMIDAQINGTVLGEVDALVEIGAIENINVNLIEDKEASGDEKTK